MTPQDVRRRAIIDAALALLLMALAVLELAGDSSEWWQYASAVLGTAPVAVRRRWPLGVLVVVALALTILSFYATETIAVAQILAMMLVAYTVAVGCPTPRAAAGLGILLASTYVNSARSPTAVVGDYVFATILVGVAWLAGLGIRRWRARAEELEELTRQLHASRQEHAELVVDVERLRIARDLHDSVAQTLNAVVVHAEVADAALGTDEAVARHALTRIREVSRESLTEIRRLLASLRGDAEQDTLPRLDGVGRLLEGFRADGMRVELRDAGTPVSLSPAVDAAAYRIVQESLTNAKQHAPGVPVTVTIVRNEALCLEVRNPLTGAPAGTAAHHYGLAGMRERAHLVGGDLIAGQDDGQFVVRARLPLVVAG